MWEKATTHLVFFGPLSSLVHGDEPHVLKDFHHQLANALFVVDPPDHQDTDLWDLLVAGVLHADLLQYFDDPLSDGDAGVEDP